MAKYTDEQIKKALECCGGGGCKGCPFHSNCAVCIGNLMRATLDLINRQEAKIAELQRKITNCNSEIETLRNSRRRWRHLANDYYRHIKEKEKEMECESNA